MRILVDTNILISAILFPNSIVSKALLHITEKLIRDVKDQPILNAAIISDVDIILTGDKDFLSLEMKHPCCMSVSDFMKSENMVEP